MMALAIIRRAMRRALQWRLLVLSPVVLLAAAAATLFPLASFLGGLFDHSTRWREVTAALDSAGLAGLAKALMTPAAAGLATGVETSLLLAVLVAPLLAGAALVVAEAEAETEARPRFRALLSGAAGYYGRLLRLQIAALIPLGVAAIVASAALVWAFHASDRATSEAAARAGGRLAWLVTAIAVFLAQLVVDAGRARFAVEPARRSALFAFGAGVKLVVKRPWRALSIGLSSTLVSLAIAAVLLVVRQQITQSGVIALLLAFLLAQLAVASIAWGHAARLCGLVEIARELAESRGAAPTSRPPAAPVPPGEPAPADAPADD